MKWTFSFQFIFTQLVLQSLGMLPICTTWHLGPARTGLTGFALPKVSRPHSYVLPTVFSVPACPLPSPGRAVSPAGPLGSRFSVMAAPLPATWKAKDPHHLAAVRGRGEPALQPQADATSPRGVLPRGKSEAAGHTRSVCLKLPYSPRSCCSSANALNSLPAR